MAVRRKTPVAKKAALKKKAPVAKKAAAKKAAPKKLAPPKKTAAKKLAAAKKAAPKRKYAPRKAKAPYVSDERPVLCGGDNFLGMPSQRVPHGMAYMLPAMTAARLELVAPGGASCFGVSTEPRAIWVVGGLATIRDAYGNMSALTPGQCVVAGANVPMGYEAGRVSATVLIIETAPVRVLEAPRAVNEAEIDQAQQAAMEPPTPQSRKPMPPPASNKARAAAIDRANRRAMRSPHRLAMPSNIAGEVQAGASPILPDGTPAGLSFHGSQQHADNAPTTLPTDSDK